MSALSVLVLRILFLRISSHDRVESIHFKIFVDKEVNKVVTVVYRGFRSYDDSVRVKWYQIRKQQIETTIVIREFERHYEYRALRRNRSGEIVKFGNINTNVDHEVEPIYHKVRYRDVH